MELKIKYKLTLTILIISFFSMAIVSIFGYYISKKSIQEQTFSKLTSLRNSKAQEITRYFQTLHNLSSCISENKVTIDAFERFNNAFNKIKNDKKINKQILICC